MIGKNNGIFWLKQLNKLMMLNIQYRVIEILLGLYNNKLLELKILLQIFMVLVLIKKSRRESFRMSINCVISRIKSFSTTTAV